MAPARVTRIGYASNDLHAKTTSSPSPQVAAMSCASTPTEPGPVEMRSAGTSRRSARARVSAVTAMSGYRLISVAADHTTSSTDGSGA